MNESIKEYLDYYTHLDVEPQYAILINGDWGAGKTWFIKNYFAENDNVTHIYISLYGINSFSDIDYQFFQQLHPVLSSKGMMIAGKVLKGLVKGALKFDIDSGGEASGSVNIGLPDNINLPDYLKNTKDKILVFDDLERADIKVEKLLGYINQFVEHNGQRVIILTNEKEIKCTKYDEIKEKIIGRTFTIIPSFDDAYDFFIEELKNDCLKKILKNFQEKIGIIFKSSENNNLRHIRHCLIEFERLFVSIERNCKKCVQNDELILDLINFYFPVFIEYDHGHLSAANIKNISNLIFGERILSDNENKGINFSKKYPMFSIRSIIFDENFWANFFINGTIDQAEIKKLNNSAVYFEEKKPIWLQLWNYFDASNHEIQIIFRKVEEKFGNDDFSNFEELAHISGSLMKLSSADIYKKNEKDILSESINQLDILFDKNKINVQLFNYHNDIERDNSMGYQYQGWDNPVFHRLLKHYGNRYAIEQNSKLNEIAKNLLEKMVSDTTEFISLISFYSPKNYQNISILDKLDKDRFINIFKELSPRNRREVILVISHRISKNSLKTEEIAWLKDIIEYLKKEFPGSNRTIESFNVNTGIVKLESDLKRSVIS